MIALVRSELYRLATIRSSWLSIAVFASLGIVFGWFSADMWALLAGMGAFGLAVTAVCQHHQHRTAVLLRFSRPRRTLVLAGQVAAAAIVTTVFAAVSGLSVLLHGELEQYRNTLLVVPVMAVFGAANAAMLRRSSFLFVGFSAWLLFVEGLIGKLAAPLPFSAFLQASTGERDGMLIFAGWSLLALAGAGIAIHRDLAGE